MVSNTVRVRGYTRPQRGEPEQEPADSVDEERWKESGETTAEVQEFWGPECQGRRDEEVGPEEAARKEYRPGEGY